MGFILTIKATFKYNWKNIWAKTDSALLVWLFKNKIESLLWKIKNRWIRPLNMTKQLNVIVSHIYREGNCVADNWHPYPPFRGL